MIFHHPNITYHLLRPIINDKYYTLSSKDTTRVIGSFNIKDADLRKRCLRGIIVPPRRNTGIKFNGVSFLNFREFGTESSCKLK